MKALIEVSTDVDEDEDPLDSIKEYGKDVVKALILNGIGEASKIGKIAKKAWHVKKTKAKPSLAYKTWGKRAWQGGFPPPAVNPAVVAPSALVAPVRTPCPVCGRTGHVEATCYQAHPELRVVCVPP